MGVCRRASMMAPQTDQSATHSPSTAPIPASSFTCFSILPKEIQLQIWDCAISNAGPRIVEIAEEHFKRDGVGRDEVANRFTSTCPIPSVLHTCSDSRTRALRRWKLAFASNSKRLGPKIFFDFSTDVLFFGDHYHINTFLDVNESERKAVRKLAFDLKSHGNYRYYSDGRDLALRTRNHFGKLKQIVFLGMKVFDGDPNGEEPKPRKSRQTVIIFSEAAFHWEYEEEFERTLRMFRNTCARKGWRCPRLTFKDYLKTDPDAGEEDWEDTDAEDVEDLEDVTGISEKYLYGEMDW